MRTFLSWLSGWAETLHIMIFEPDLYRRLRDGDDIDLDEFMEAMRPDERWPGDA